MSNVICKEFKGWCKSFTKTELLLCAIQAVLFIVFVAFLSFVILHLIACSKSRQKLDNLEPTLSELGVESTENTTSAENIVNDKCYACTSSTENRHVFITTKTAVFPYVTNGQGRNKSTLSNITRNDMHTIPSLASSSKKRITCTWQPLQKTEAVKHYYEFTPIPKRNHKTTIASENSAVIYKTHSYQLSRGSQQDQHLDNYKLLDVLDGEDAYDARKDSLLALVKIRPPQGLTFGCTLTIISNYWVLTAATCIETIEEVDSLDSFVMIQDFGSTNLGTVHPISDVIIHPHFQGVNMTYDLAALKSVDNLVKKATLFVKLPTLIDYFLITIGERLTILGYGRFRGTEGPGRARAVRVCSLPRSQCAQADGWSARQLWGGRALPTQTCGARPLCAGVLHDRSAPCGYCAGTPLLKRRVLLGIMSDNRLCGLACEPALYVNLALVGDWLSSITRSD